MNMMCSPNKKTDRPPARPTKCFRQEKIFLRETSENN
jgi:hypothetical protein